MEPVTALYHLNLFLAAFGYVIFIVGAFLFWKFPYFWLMYPMMLIGYTYTYAKDLENMLRVLTDPVAIQRQITARSIIDAVFTLPVILYLWAVFGEQRKHERARP